jgi:hypothetical protein
MPWSLRFCSRLPSSHSNCIYGVYIHRGASATRASCCPITPHLSRRALRCPARSKRIMQWRACGAHVSPYHGRLELLVCSVAGTRRDKVRPMDASEFSGEPARSNCGSGLQPKTVNKRAAAHRPS